MALPSRIEDAGPSSAPPPAGGYRASADYHPTMIAVRCGSCKSMGIVEFVGGFSLKLGDDLMEGRPIRGECRSLACGGRRRELIPIQKFLTEDMKDKFAHEYNAAKTLEFYAQRGQQINAGQTMMPLARLKEHERQITEYERQLNAATG